MKIKSIDEHELDILEEKDCITTYMQVSDEDVEKVKVLLNSRCIDREDKARVILDKYSYYKTPYIETT